jgi:hypothetical protein
MEPESRKLQTTRPLMKSWTKFLRLLGEGITIHYIYYLPDLTHMIIPDI